VVVRLLAMQKVPSSTLGRRSIFPLYSKTKFSDNLSMPALTDEYNILYVDGNETRKKQTSSRLRMQAFNVELAQGGFHAIHLVEKHPFNLVIIQGDELEDMPAEEIVGLLRNVHTRDELPILAILPEADDEAAASLAESGANEIIINNGNFNMVLSEIEKLQKKTPKKK
tara:strand:+ start:119344 stop:119850 length:507 start_codon:yes stop_codon:yes gene_type:complete